VGVEFSKKNKHKHTVMHYIIVCSLADIPNDRFSTVLNDTGSLALFIRMRVIHRMAAGIRFPILVNDGHSIE
jgi:hypothetical protein